MHIPLTRERKKRGMKRADAFYLAVNDEAMIFDTNLSTIIESINKRKSTERQSFCSSCLIEIESLNNLL